MTQSRKECKRKVEGIEYSAGNTTDSSVMKPDLETRKRTVGDRKARGEGCRAAQASGTEPFRVQRNHGRFHVTQATNSEDVYERRSQ